MADQTGPTLWLGVTGALGVVLSFLTILRAEQSQIPLLRLKKFLAKTANRDFSVLLVILAIAEHVQWFLWIALLAVHAFWIYGAWLRRKDEQEEAQ